MKKVTNGIVYQHYKGQTYLEVATATHTETRERLSIYRNTRDSVFEKNGWHARPCKMFNDQVLNTNGEQVRRFTQVGVTNEVPDLYPAIVVSLLITLALISVLVWS